MYFRLIYFMCARVRFLHLCVCTTYVTGAGAGQGWALAPLKMESDMLVSAMWVLGTESWSSAGAVSALMEQRSVYITKMVAEKV